MFAASFCACRSHWLQWDTCLFKSRNMAVSYGLNFWVFFPNCSYFSASLHGASCHMLCFLKDYTLFAFSIKAITHTHVFFISANNIAHTYEKIYLCCRQKLHRSCADFQTTVINCFINQDISAVLTWWSRCRLCFNPIRQKGESRSNKEKQIQDVDG